MYISFLFTRPECSEYIIILYTVVNKQSVRDFSHIVFLWLKYCIPQCLCYKFYCMEDDLSGYFTANWKNWEKKILESGLGKKYSTVETVHELPCSCKKHRIIIRLLAWASKLASGSILHPPFWKPVLVLLVSSLVQALLKYRYRYVLKEERWACDNRPL